MSKLVVAVQEEDGSTSSLLQVVLGSQNHHDLLRMFINFISDHTDLIALYEEERLKETLIDALNKQREEEIDRARELFISMKKGEDNG